MCEKEKEMGEFALWKDNTKSYKPKDGCSTQTYAQYNQKKTYESKQQLYRTLAIINTKLAT